MRSTFVSLLTGFTMLCTSTVALAGSQPVQPTAGIVEQQVDQTFSTRDRVVIGGMGAAGLAVGSSIAWSGVGAFLAATSVGAVALAALPVAVGGFVIGYGGYLVYHAITGHAVVTQKTIVIGISGAEPDSGDNVGRNASTTGGVAVAPVPSAPTANAGMHH